MSSFFEGEYEAPSDAELPEGSSAQEKADLPSSKQNLRVVSPTDFEPAEAVSSDKSDAYFSRFSILFVDEESARRGGIGVVYFASNSFGERLALKVLKQEEPDAAGHDGEEGLHGEKLELLFREEFECHKRLSGIKGFPRLYGYCKIEGAPALVMEWVEGVSIKEAQSLLAVNDDGALSPIVVGRIGRDLFEAVSRLSVLGDSVIHRDLSPANVIIRTSKMSLYDQLDEGSFDVCLIDFGSSTFPHESDLSFTESASFVRRATPNYAPPEMLAEADGGASASLRASAKIDVYATASILFELCSGVVPFDLAEAFLEGKTFAEYKREAEPRKFRFPHCEKEAFYGALENEPELAVSLELNGHDLSDFDQNLMEAIDFVDRQLGDMLRSCLRGEQSSRPDPDEMWGGLSSFCSYYYRNIELAYKGEPLIPCMIDGEPRGDADLLIELRDTIRSVSKGASLAVLLVVAISAGLLTAGTSVTLNLAFFSWEGKLSGFDVSFFLILPSILGSAFFRGSSKRNSFMGATAGVAAGSLISALCVMGTECASTGFQGALYAALAASTFAAWCPVVMDYSLGKIVPLARKIKRKALPESREAKGAFGLAQRKELPASSEQLEGGQK